MSQTTRIKLDRVQNEPIRVILGTTKDTLTEPMRFMLASHQCKTRQKVEQVKAYFSALELCCFGNGYFRLDFGRCCRAVQSFESVLSCFPIRVVLLHTISFTQYAIAAASNAVSTRPIQRTDSMALLCVRVAWLFPHRAVNLVTWSHTDKQTCLTAHAARVGPRSETWVKACDLQQGSSKGTVRVAWVDQVVGDGQATVGKDPRLEGLVVITQDAVFWLGCFTSGVAPKPKTLTEISFVDVLQTD